MVAEHIVLQEIDGSRRIEVPVVAKPDAGTAPTAEIHISALVLEQYRHIWIELAFAAASVPGAAREHEYVFASEVLGPRFLRLRSRCDDAPRWCTLLERPDERIDDILRVAARRSEDDADQRKVRHEHRASHSSPGG